MVYYFCGLQKKLVLASECICVPCFNKRVSTVDLWSCNSPVQIFLCCFISLTTILDDKWFLVKLVDQYFFDRQLDKMFN